MKRIYLLLNFITLLFLASCSLFSEIPDFIDELIPDEIDANLTLVEKHLDYNLKYFINDVEETDYIIDFPYLLEDTKYTIKLSVHTNFTSKTFEKEVTFKKSKAVNDLYIATLDGNDIYSKDEYKKGIVSIENSTNFDINSRSMQIKGRGNSSWWVYPKKPYRIKFDEKTSLLGMKKARDYVLLAEYGDKSLLRNYVAHMMSEYLNIEYSLEYRFVNLYLNGRYDGVYLLTEQVEFDDNRLNIDTSKGKNAWLLEMDNFERLDEDDQLLFDYITMFSRPFSIKEPNLVEFDYYTRQTKIAEIRTYINSAYQSMNKPNYDEYIDVDNFIDYFIIQEITKNVDINYSSVYMYKADGGKLKMGPLWDFDISMGNGDYYPYQPYGYKATENIFLNKLLDSEAFRTRYIQRMKEVINMYGDIFKENLTKMYFLISEAALANFERWQILGYYDWPNPPEMVQANTHLKQYTYLFTWLDQRLTWLEGNIDTI